MHTLQSLGFRYVRNTAAEKHLRNSNSQRQSRPALHQYPQMFIKTGAKELIMIYSFHGMDSTANIYIDNKNQYPAGKKQVTKG